MAFDLYSLICSSGEDEFLKNESVHLTLKSSKESHTYYVPHAVMKIINNKLHTEKLVEIDVGHMNDVQNVFTDICNDISRGNKHVHIDNARKLERYVLHDLLTGTKYKIGTPKFKTIDEYDKYNKLILDHCDPRYRKEILDAYYMDESDSFLYELMHTHNIKIPKCVMDQKILTVKVHTKYDVSVLSKFSDLKYVYFHNRGDWDHFYYAYTKIYLNDTLGGYNICKPKLYGEHRGHEEWKEDKFNVEQLFVNNKYKTISFDCHGKFTLE